jgi:hypothetical protein
MKKHTAKNQKKKHKIDAVQEKGDRPRFSCMRSALSNA